MLGRLARPIQLLRYGLGSRRSLYYLGVVGMHNLGDEALQTAVSRTFHPAKVEHVPPLARPRWLGSLVRERSHRAVILGGGTLIGGGARNAGNPILEQYAERLDRYGRGVAFGTGVATFHPPGADPEQDEWLARWKPLLLRSAFVSVRGPLSARTLASVGVASEVVGDPACGLVCPEGFWRPEGKILGVNLGRAEGNVAGGEDRALEELRGFLEGQRAAGRSVEFFVVWPKDLDITRRIAEESGFGDAPIHLCYHDADRFLAQVRRMRAFVGLKLHSFILALCAGVPSILLAYQPKCHDFCASVSLERLMLPTSGIDRRGLAELLGRLEAEGDGASQDILEKLQACKKRLESAAARIRAMLDSGPEKGGRA